jgi:hypothetical protein
VSQNFTEKPRIPLRSNGAPPSFKETLGRGLAYVGLVGFLCGIFAYGFPGCKTAADGNYDAQHLEVVPSDARGKLEYCGVKVFYSRTGEKTYSGPFKDLCGPTKDAVTAAVQDYQAHSRDHYQGCWVHSSVLGYLRRYLFLDNLG